MDSRRRTQASPLLDALLPAIGAANVLAVAIAALFVVPQFVTLFSEFGTDLPGSTRLTLATYRGWWLGVVLVPVVWALWPNARSRGIAGLLAGTAAALVLAAFGLWSCYAPIFGLAAVVR